MPTINGWTILAHPLFLDQFERLIATVGTLKAKKPDNYQKTAEAKLPAMKEYVEDLLEAGHKMLIFAHHQAVLDAFETAFMEKHHRHIRIDGKTPPSGRQELCNSFQQDPSIRIALLSITAASTGLTLTAATTVVFAELFWNPGVMIQAEDRCHRIGQNSRVQCLYFVATGTLDDLLWKLLEKKFRDLGEFVEGLEKQKIVVHKTFHGIKDVDAIFENLDERSRTIRFDF